MGSAKEMTVITYIKNDQRIRRPVEGPEDRAGEGISCSTVKERRMKCIVIGQTRRPKYFVEVGLRCN